MLNLISSALLAAFQAIPQLFSPTALPEDLSVGNIEDASQYRVVQINEALLEESAEELYLSLMPGVTVLARHIGTDYFPDGIVWRGEVVGENDSTVDLSLSNQVLMGTVRYHDVFFQIEYAGNSTHRVKLIDESLAPKCGTDASHEIKSSIEKKHLGASTPQTSNTVIDVLVVYSTAAKNAVGGSSAMTSKINLAISESNSAYSSSFVNQELSLVHKAEMVGYTEPSSFSQILYDLTDQNDGDMDNVHALRDQYDADMVAMICRNSQYCGIAWLMTNVSVGFASNAFSVTNYSCATGYYSFAHELGHNMGSSHDPQNASSGAYSYSFGYRTSNNAYRTVMAYSPGSRILRFSNPNVTYNGYTMGNASQDNARSLNNTSSTVADFRIGTPPPPQGPILTVPTLTGGSGVIMNVEQCSPNNDVYFLYSLTGPGPSVTSYGTASLSFPIKVLIQRTTTNTGTASWYGVVPISASGRQIWLQALDASSLTWSNGVYQLIL